MTGINIVGADHNLWDAITGFDWSSWPALVAAGLLLLALVIVALGIFSAVKEADPSLALLIALVSLIPSLTGVAVIQGTYLSELRDNARIAVEDEYNIEFMDGNSENSKVSILDALDESNPAVARVDFYDEAFSAYEGYLVRVGPNTIALAIATDSEGSELVEWESGLPLESGLEELGSD